MFRYFDWLAMRESSDWTFILVSFASALAFGIIFGYILAIGTGVI